MFSKVLPWAVVAMLLLAIIDQGIMDEINLCLCHGQNNVTLNLFSRRLCPVCEGQGLPRGQSWVQGWNLRPMHLQQAPLQGAGKGIDWYWHLNK